MFTITSKEKEKDKRSFFERLTGTINLEENDEGAGEERTFPKVATQHPGAPAGGAPSHGEWLDEEASEGELAVDVYQTDKEIIVQAMVAGVSPDTLNVSVTREMVTIKGRRDPLQQIPSAQYFTRELYWGGFSRTLVLPQEIEPELVEASQKHGLLMLKLPKIDKARVQNIRVKQG